MAGVEAEAEVADGPGGLEIGGDGPLSVFRVEGRVVGGVELDAVGAALEGAFRHAGIGVDEDGGADAAGLERGAGALEEGMVADGVPAGAGREGVRGVGHQGDLVGDDFADQGGETAGRIAFDVEFRPQRRAERAHVAVADVAFVGAGVDGDAVGAESLAVQRNLQDVRQVAAAGVAQQGDLVDIYT